jgi:hypothetical protein
MAGWTKLISREAAQGSCQVVAHQVQPWISTTTDGSKHHDAIGTTHRHCTRQNHPPSQGIWNRLGQKIPYRGSVQMTLS